MSDYIYLYRGGETARSPERMQQTMQKWLAWMKMLKDQGHLRDPGHPLEGRGKVLHGKQKTVTDGPFAELKDIVGGFTIVIADDLEQAVDLAKGCPIFEDDGIVEVRPILEVSV